jgi:probable F420-dependent oxidoreductase
MKFGYLTINHAGGIRPDVLATALEDRGYDSIWVPEHSHIPVDRISPYPGGGDLPDGYWNMMDPFVSLMAAAGATTNLTLATGICLLLEHDLLDLACTTATLDVLSEGRLLLGIGVGWNAEELANHSDIPFRLRYQAMEERVAALKIAWTEDEPEFDGRWDRFTKSWVYPKPVQQGGPPVALGNAGPIGIRHAAKYADHWCPIDASLHDESGRPDVAGRIADFRRQVSEGGRNPEDVPISLFSWGRPPRRRLDEYRELGVERVVVGPSTFDTNTPDQTLSFLDHFVDDIADLG